MGHLLATTNPEAVERINGGGIPLPGVATMVLYHPRAGEVRRGRVTVPAVVLNVDESNRQLELLIIHSSDDMITQERVPEHIEGDRGWSRVPGVMVNWGAAVERLIEQNKAQQAQIDALNRMLLGDFEGVPEGESVLSMLDTQDERVGKLEEDAAAVGAAVRTAKPENWPDVPPGGRKRRLRR